MLRIIEKIYAANPSIDELYEATKIDPNDTADLIVLVPRIIGWILWIGSVLIFIYILISGIQFITAGGNAEQAKKGQQGLIYGIIGAIVMALSFVLVKVVNQMANGNAPGN